VIRARVHVGVHVLLHPTQRFEHPAAAPDLAENRLEEIRLAHEAAPADPKHPEEIRKILGAQATDDLFPPVVERLELVFVLALAMPD
jgi:hypothetical protein